MKNSSTLSLGATSFTRIFAHLDQSTRLGIPEDNYLLRHFDDLELKLIQQGFIGAVYDGSTKFCSLHGSPSPTSGNAGLDIT